MEAKWIPSALEVHLKGSSGALEVQFEGPEGHLEATWRPLGVHLDAKWSPSALEVHLKGSSGALEGLQKEAQQSFGSLESLEST